MRKRISPLFLFSKGNGGTVNLAQLATTDDNKTCYIAQPVGGYNYALVNGMPLNQGTALGIATVDAQGRIQIVNQNKPITAVSDLGFKFFCLYILEPFLVLEHNI